MDKNLHCLFLRSLRSFAARSSLVADSPRPSFRRQSCAGARMGYVLCRMSIFLVMFVWLLMAAILVAGVVLAVKGSFWLLLIGLIGFVLAVAKYGILSH